MATPEYIHLVPPSTEFGDEAAWAELVELAQTGQLDRVKQSLASYRRKRTTAHNAVKETRRLLALEELEGAERAEREHTLTSQTSAWADANKACRTLEKIEEAIEYTTVFDRAPEALSSDDEGFVTTSSNPQVSPRGLHTSASPAGPMPVGGMGGLQTLRSQVTTPPTDHSGQSAARGVTTHTVTKVDLPKLKDRFSLEHHLRICENMLLEAEVGQRSGGQFQPISRLQYNVVTKILGTLELHKDIFELASDTAEQNDHKWGPVKEVLLMTHAKRESLIEEFRASTIRLKYADVDKFCADARKLYAMAIRLFGAGNTYEIRGLIETLVSKLPADRASGLISEVHRIANLGAYTPEWPLAVNFDGSDQSLLGILNRLERQEGAVRSLRSVSKSSAARMAEAEEVCDAKAVEAAKSSAPVKSQPGGQRPPNSVRTWCSQYSEGSLIKVYECWGDVLKGKVPEMVGSFALKTRFRRNPIFRIVALKDDAGRDEVIARLKKEGVRAEIFVPFQ